MQDRSRRASLGRGFKIAQHLCHGQQIGLQAAALRRIVRLRDVAAGVAIIQPGNRQDQALAAALQGGDIGPGGSRDLFVLVFIALSLGDALALAHGGHIALKLAQHKL